MIVNFQLNLKDRYKIAFLLVVILKIVISGLFSSGYVNDNFVIFIQWFNYNLGNPWQYFYLNNLGVSFNYPPLMLFILSPFVWLIDILGISSVFLQNIIFKLPYLASDIAILLLLNRLYPEKRKVLFVLYFLSPIVIFSTYVLSLLDIIPTAMLFGSIYYLSKQRFKTSAVFYAFAILIKTHLLMIAPFLIIYLYKNHEFKAILLSSLIIAGICLVSIAPFYSEGLIFFLFQNPEQNLIFNTVYDIGELQLYVIPLFLSFIGFRFICHNKINFDLLLGYIMLAFIMVILFTFPMPSWYLWIMPYVFIFAASIWNVNARKIFILIAALNIIYLIYFLNFYYNPIRSFADLYFLDQELSLSNIALHSRMHYLVFTLLVSTLLCIGHFIFNFAINSNNLYSKDNVIIAVSGDSGSGKSTFVHNVLSLINKRKLVAIEGDGEHKWSRHDSNWSKRTHLDPKANKLHFQTEYLANLKNNQAIYRQDYNHATGNFDEVKKILPKQYIVLSGLHSFYLPFARKLCDIKIFLDTDQELIKLWKISRDSKERGYSKEKVSKAIEVRRVDREKYILPQANFADVILKIFILNKEESSIDVDQMSFGLEIKLSANIDLDLLINLMETRAGLVVEHDFSDDINSQIMTVTGDTDAHKIEEVAFASIPNIKEILDSEYQFERGFSGVMQLITLFYIYFNQSKKNKMGNL
jgi:uridine kinase